MPTESLWPEDLEVRTPLSVGIILRQQAAALGQKTKNVVKARVDTRSAERGPNMVFIHDFSLQAPIINFSYPLLSAEHSVSDNYPVHLSTGLLTFTKDVENEEELMEYLRTVFNHEKVKVLIAQMRAFSQPQPTKN